MARRARHRSRIGSEDCVSWLEYLMSVGVGPAVKSLGTELRVAVGRLSRQLRRVYSVAGGADQPSFLEMAVLVRIQREGGLSAADIAPRERVTVQAVSSAVAALRHRGLVTTSTDDDDRRRTRVEVTAAGRAALAGKEQALGRRLESALDALTPDDRQTLHAAVPILERLAELL
jgi:DNA-binding MarR family transcriptional regulator